MDLDEGVAAAASGGDATAGAHIPRTSPLVSCHAGETAEGMDVDGVEGQAAALALQTEPAAVDGGGAEVGLAAHADAQLQVQQQLGPGPMRTRLRSAAATPAAAATVAALTPMTLAPAAAAKGGAAVKPAAAVDIAARRGRAGLKSNIARHAPQVSATQLHSVMALALQYVNIRHVNTHVTTATCRQLSCVGRQHRQTKCGIFVLCRWMPEAMQAR